MYIHCATQEGFSCGGNKDGRWLFPGDLFSLLKMVKYKPCLLADKG